MNFGAACLLMKSKPTLVRSFIQLQPLYDAKVTAAAAAAAVDTLVELEVMKPHTVLLFFKMQRIKRTLT
jgi:hypothetical protein